MRQLKITHSITSRESIAVEKYLQEIAKIELLTPEQESELAKRIQMGDHEALESLVRGNLRFVVSVAKQYQNQGLSLSDLINEGNVGLMKAAKRFDETKGFKFISYAVWWIRQAILHAIVEYSRMVRLPHNKTKEYLRLHAEYNKFVQKNEREPTHEELADIMEQDIETIKNLLGNSLKHISVDAPISDDSDSIPIIDLMTIGDEESPDRGLMNESFRIEILDSMEYLSPREVQVVSSFYGLDGDKPLSLEEISMKYNLSRERVRQVKERALRRMRRSFNKPSSESVNF